MAEEGNFLRHFLIGGKRMLDNELGSFKTLENVHLKATYDIEANGI